MAARTLVLGATFLALVSAHAAAAAAAAAAQRPPPRPPATVPAEPMDDDGGLRSWWVAPNTFRMLPADAPQPTVATVVEALRDRSREAQVRVSACYHLATRKGEAAAALPALTEALADPALDVHAAVAVIRIATNVDPAWAAPPAIRPYLLATDVRPLPAEARPAVEVLMAALRSGESERCQVAQRAMTELGPARGGLMTALRAEARAAAAASAMTRPAATQVADEKWEARRFYTMFTIGQFARSAPHEASDHELAEAAEEVVAWAREATGKDRFSALSNVTRTGRPAAAAAPDLVARLADADPEIRLRAATALSSLGVTDSKRAIPILVEAMKRDPNSFAANDAAAALAKAGPPDAAAADAVLDMAGGEYVTTTILDSLGPSSGRLVAEGLRKRLGDRLADAKQVATAEALARCGSAADRAFAVGLLANALPTYPQGVAAAAAAALIRLHERQPAVVAAALPWLTGSDWQVRGAAAAALRQVGPADAAAVPALLKALSDPSVRRRAAAVDALGRIGAGAGAALPKLKEMAKADVNEWVRPIAALAVSRLEAKPATRPASEPAR